MSRRVGVLGGTFDPPHRGHLQLGRLARDRLGLNRVLFVPCFHLPHHKGLVVAPYEDRVRMAELLLEGKLGMGVERIEATLEPPTYTVRMLRALQEKLGPRTELFFLMGADSLEDLHRWYRYQDIFELAQVVALSRPGHSLDAPCLPRGLAEQVVRIEGLAEEARSSSLRRGGEPAGALPPAVAGYIRKHGLYGQ